MRAEHVGLPGIPAATDLLDLLPVGVAWLDRSGAVIGANATLIRMLDARPELARGGRLTDHGWRTVDGGVGVAREDLLAAAGSGAAWTLDLVHDSGRRLVVRVRAERVRLADPDVAYALTVTDVTAEHVLEEQARERERQYRILADHVGDAALVHRGPGMPVAWASPSVRAVLGMDPEQLVGHRLADLAHPEDVGDLPVLHPGRPPARHRVRLRRGDGEWR
jgi:PAS domain-containing protein